MDNIKKFEDFLDRMRGLLNEAKKQGHIIVRVEDLENTFPELKESEDEKIRKKLRLSSKGIATDADEDELLYGLPYNDIIAWLEKQGEQKPDKNKGMNLVEEEMTPFQKEVFCIIDTTIEEEQGLKQVCDELLRLAHDEIMWNHAWSEEDEKILNLIIARLHSHPNVEAEEYGKDYHWIKSLKERVQSQSTWKPSDEQLGIIAQSVAALKVFGYGELGDRLGDISEQLHKLREE